MAPCAGWKWFFNLNTWSSLCLFSIRASTITANSSSWFYARCNSSCSADCWCCRWNSTCWPQLRLFNTTFLLRHWAATTGPATISTGTKFKNCYALKIQKDVKWNEVLQLPVGSVVIRTELRCGVLSKWEFFIKMRAAFIASILEQRGQLSFWWKILNLIEHYGRCHIG